MHSRGRPMFSRKGTEKSFGGESYEKSHEETIAKRGGRTKKKH